MAIIVIYHISRDGEVIGEFSTDELRLHRAKGSILPDDYYWTEGMTDWQKVALLPMLNGAARQAIATPRPAPEVHVPMRKVKAIALTAGIAVLLAIAIGMLPGKKKKEKASLGPPNVTVQASAFEIQVTNEGSPNWATMDIFLNDLPPSSYEWEGRAPGVGETIRVPLSEFTTRDQERFDGFRTKLRKAWIGGGGYDYQEIGFH